MYKGLANPFASIRYQWRNYEFPLGKGNYIFSVENCKLY